MATALGSAEHFATEAVSEVRGPAGPLPANEATETVFDGFEPPPERVAIDIGGHALRLYELGAAGPSVVGDIQLRCFIEDASWQHIEDVTHHADR